MLEDGHDGGNELIKHDMPRPRPRPRRRQATVPHIVAAVKVMRAKPMEMTSTAVAVEARTEGRRQGLGRRRKE